MQWLGEEEMRAWRSLVVVSSRLFDALDAELRAAHDLSLADYEILASLSEVPERRLRMSQLADGAMVSRSRLTHHVNRMEAEGLVTREACPTDRRGAFAVLSAEGLARVEAAAPTHVAGVRRLFFDLLPGPALAAVSEALATVAERLLPAQGAARAELPAQGAARSAPPAQGAARAAPPAQGAARAAPPARTPNPSSGPPAAGRG